MQKQTRQLIAGLLAVTWLALTCCASDTAESFRPARGRRQNRQSAWARKEAASVDPGRRPPDRRAEAAGDPSEGRLEAVR
jgi:hypothetical protein